MAFNFLAFAQQEMIPHTVGPAKNIRRDHVGIKCPFCNDTGRHFSYSIKSGRWGCWRCPARGKRPERLIMAIKGCNLDKAKEIARDEMLAEELSWEELSDRAYDLFKPQRKARVESLELPEEFQAIDRTSRKRKFWDYLEGRGFGHVGLVADTYGLLCCLTGRYKDRLIIPVKTNGVLIGWTARTIHPEHEPRYIAHPTGDAVKRGIAFYDEIKSRRHGEVLAIVEGGLDAPMLDFYSAPDIAALPIMGTSATPAQINLILDLAPRYRKTVVLLDKAAEVAALHLASQLSSANATVAFLPEGIKDPGSMTPKQVRRFSRYLLK